MPLTPARRRGVERLDEPGVAPADRVRSLRDVARSNTLFGGRRAVLREVERALRECGPQGSLLDVGTGLADIPAGAARRARRRGLALTTIGLDRAEELVREARRRVDAVVVGDALHLPFADASVDVVTCSQLLHHFAEPEARILIAELDRVAVRRVVIGDLRRSWLAAGLFWLAAWPLRFDPITRHDGVLSVLRGFTAGELRSLVRDATGGAATVRRGAGWRLTAAWTPQRRAPA
ncbi:MAG TPA: methyltransferase domain-containing protein [Gemmatimonadaceae bacterium]|nr:methyltransferase domain-containing protein [Gemmatimonadaceae bacterium]